MRVAHLFSTASSIVSRRSRASIVLLASLASFSACSSSSDGGAAAAGQKDVDDYCTHSCTAQVKCISGDQSTCIAACKNDLASAGTKVRADYLSGILGCIDGVECAKWSTDAAKCPDVARASIAPTQSAQDICNDTLKKEKDCSQPVGDLAKCLDLFKIYGDPALQAARACLAKPCADYGACALAELGITK